MKIKIKSCRILRLYVDNGVKRYQLEVFFDTGEAKRGLMIPFTDIEGINEVVRFPSVNKVRNWLNSNEGLRYLEKKF